MDYSNINDIDGTSLRRINRFLWTLYNLKIAHINGEHFTVIHSYNQSTHLVEMELV